MLHGRSLTLLALVSLTLSIGCGDGAELQEPDINIAIPDAPSGEEQEQYAGTSDFGGRNQTGPLPQGSLRFSLKKGDRFPLRKEVVQTLVQDLPDGQVTSTSNLTLMFAITVDAEDNGRRQLSVRYQRVKYSLDLPGEQMVYDSLNPPDVVVDSLQMYHGMANNGFDFWIGADNRILQVVGFHDFLKRCVRFAPPQRQHELLKGILAGSEDEGFANFVDDSIGLLPYNASAEGRETMVRVDESWSRKRDLREPLPMRIRTTYTMTDLTDHQAQVSVLGTIEPITATQMAPVQQAAFEERVTLEGGQVLGTITIDVATGLPLESRVERRLKMNVYADGQAPFQQYKTIVTTVSAFPATGRVTTRAPAAGPMPAQNLRAP